MSLNIFEGPIISDNTVKGFCGKYDSDVGDHWYNTNISRCLKSIEGQIQQVMQKDRKWLTRGGMRGSS